MYLCEEDKIKQYLDDSVAIRTRYGLGRHTTPEGKSVFYIEDLDRLKNLNDPIMKQIIRDWVVEKKKRGQWSDVQKEVRDNRPATNHE